MGHGEVCNRVGDLPLSQALCLPVSAEEIIDTCDMLQVAGDDIEQVKDDFFSLVIHERFILVNGIFGKMFEVRAYLIFVDTFQ